MKYFISVAILSFFLMSFTGYAVKLSDQKGSTKLEEFVTEQKLFANGKKIISYHSNELNNVGQQQERSKRFFLYQNKN